MKKPHYRALKGENKGIEAPKMTEGLQRGPL